MIITVKYWCGRALLSTAAAAALLHHGHHSIVCRHFVCFFLPWIQFCPFCHIKDVCFLPLKLHWPHLSYGLVRSKREFCHNCSLWYCAAFCSCTVIWAAHRPVKTVGRITYIVLVQTLNHAQSINQWRVLPDGPAATMETGVLQLQVLNCGTAFQLILRDKLTLSSAIKLLLGTLLFGCWDRGALWLTVN